MRRVTIAALVAGAMPAVAAAAPALVVADSYSSNAWTSPATCAAGTAVTLTPACAPSVTIVSGTPSGFQLSRSNTAPGAFGFSRATSFDNGVLTARVESGGVENVVARAQFVETYNYVGPASTPYLVPFTITRFSLATNSSGIGDLQRARMMIAIDVTTNNVTTNVATLDWLAQSNSVTAFAQTPAPTPLAGVTLAPGFLSFAGVTTPNSAAAVVGPGGAMTVDLGSFATGQAFTLAYRMECRSFGTGPGTAFCGVGDPFAIPTGPGFDLQGLAVASGAVPEPTSWAMLVTGFGLAGSALRRRRQVVAPRS